MKKLLFILGVLIIILGFATLFSCGDDVNQTGQTNNASTVETETETEGDNATGDGSHDEDCDEATDDDETVDISESRAYQLPPDYNNDSCFLERKDDISFLTCSTLIFISVKTGATWTSGKDVVGFELNASIVNLVNADIYSLAISKYSTYDAFITDFHTYGDDPRYIKGPYGNYEYLKDFLYSQIIDYHSYLSKTASQ